QVIHTPDLPAPPHGPAPHDLAPLAPGAVELPAASALLVVRLPADAELWAGDRKTFQQGDLRLLQTPPLAGDTGTYELRVRWRVNGKEVEQSRTVQVRPGGRLLVDFLAADPPSADGAEPLGRPPRVGDPRPRHRARPGPGA